MNNPLHLALSAAVARVLRALVRITLRHGIPASVFIQLVKQAYVQVAISDFSIPGRKQSVSRVALLTGLTRKEAQRLSELPDGSDVEDIERHNRAARVVAAWVRDRAFHGRDAEPAALSFEGGEGSYAALVRRYGGDVPARAMLDELLRVGAVERLDDGRIRLVERAYVPKNSDPDKLAILGADAANLIATIDHNLRPETGAPYFQRKVEYDNLPLESIDEFREFSRTRSQRLIETMDDWLSRHDRDTNPEVRGTGRMRTGVGIYYFEEDLGNSKGETKSKRGTQ